MATITQVNHRKDGNFGITRYATELRKRINYDQEIYGTNLPSFVDYFFIIPLKVLFAKKTDTYHISFPQGGLVAPIVRLFGKKVVSTVQDINPIRNNYWHPLVWPNLAIYRFSHKIIFISELVKQDWCKMFGEDDRLCVIPCGIGPEFKPDSKPQKTFTVGYVGNYKKHKNVQVLIEAKKRMINENIRLLLIGKGSIEFTSVEYDILPVPIVSNEHLPSIYNNFDVFVFPSLEEGFGMPILEAMACGLSVIVFKNVHIPEEVTRYCFKVEDEEELIECIRFLKNTRYKESNMCVKYARNFDWNNIAKKTLELF